MVELYGRSESTPYNPKCHDSPLIFYLPTTNTMTPLPTFYEQLHQTSQHHNCLRRAHYLLCLHHTYTTIIPWLSPEPTTKTHMSHQHGRYIVVLSPKIIIKKALLPYNPPAQIPPNDNPPPCTTPTNISSPMPLHTLLTLLIPHSHPHPS